ncbi:hypothetical protein GCM10022237_12310 [Nocardioides ginsengisoli]|uniref:GerMN domain-containing protein n=1 Tax=Nocardioides ginsengisoli TaxID=363868 RepID=A0ABW3W8H3_9ACTN
MSPDEDARLHDLFHDAVREVTPADRLGEIRRRTAYRPGRSRRRRALVVLAAGTATAAVVGISALVGTLRHDAPPAADRPKPYPAAVYFVAETPIGPRLYREFQTVAGSTDPATRVLDALQRMETGAGPDDPDYRTSWPDGSFRSVSVDDAGITIELADVAVPAPSGVARDAVALSVQQAVHTADAAIGSPLPVAFEQDGVPLSEVLGVAVEPTTTRLTRVEAPVNISDPAEGLVTGARWLSVRGQVTPVAAERPARVAYELSSATGTIGAGDVAVEGQSWSMTIDLADYAPGSYTLKAWSADDPTVAEATDTRTFVVR